MLARFMWSNHMALEKVKLYCYYCSMSYALHHSNALEVISLTYGHDRTGTASWDAAPYLVGYAGRSHLHCTHMHL